MAVTHFKFTFLPDPTIVESEINAVAAQVNVYYPIADQSTIKFRRTAAYDGTAVYAEAGYKTHDSAVPADSNEAIMAIQWGEPTTTSDSGGGGGTTEPSITLYEHSLGAGATAGEACTNQTSAPGVYYLDTDTFDPSTVIYTDSGGTTLAPAGFYSNGASVKEWDGSAFTGSAQMCPV